MREQLTDGETAQVLRGALATRDPHLLTGPLTNVTEDGIAFDGELYKSAERRDIYREATQLLACDLGDVCDEHDLHVAFACIATGACVGDRVELLRRQLAESDPSGASWQEVLKLRAKLLDAVDRRDPGPFSRAAASAPRPSSPP